MTLQDATGTGAALVRRAPRGAWRLLGVLGLLFSGVQAAAQPETGQGVAVFLFAEPGQPVISVDLWGSVRQPGRYLVAPETGLLDLLTIAGGPQLQAETDQVVRSVTVEVSRASSLDRSIVFTSELQALTSGEATPPPLLDGDVVTVQTSVNQRFTWLNGLTVVASVASIALIILRVASISGGI
ncbi:MAG TPA: hypothetical protein VK002_05590 [Rubricoccaceae bacterium]|nr:hypothetical protein [Rubricoccaceae bacterium]